MIKEIITAYRSAAPILELLDNAFRIVHPVVFFAVFDRVERYFTQRIREVSRCQSQHAVGAGTKQKRRSECQSRRKYVAAVVIGMLTDQIDPARSLVIPNSFGLSAKTK